MSTAKNINYDNIIELEKILKYKNKISNQKTTMKKAEEEFENKEFIKDYLVDNLKDLECNVVSLESNILGYNSNTYIIDNLSKKLEVSFMKNENAIPWFSIISLCFSSIVFTLCLSFILFFYCTGFEPIPLYIWFLNLIGSLGIVFTSIKSIKNLEKWLHEKK